MCRILTVLLIKRMVAGVLRQCTVCAMQQGSDILFPLLSLTMRDGPGPGPATATSASAAHLQRGLSWPELVTANSDYMHGKHSRHNIYTVSTAYLPTIYSLTTLSAHYLLYTLSIQTVVNIAATLPSHVTSLLCKHWCQWRM